MPAAARYDIDLAAKTAQDAWRVWNLLQLHCIQEGAMWQQSGGSGPLPAKSWAVNFTVTVNFTLWVRSHCTMSSWYRILLRWILSHGVPKFRREGCHVRTRNRIRKAWIVCHPTAFWSWSWSKASVNEKPENPIPLPWPHKARNRRLKSPTLKGPREGQHWLVRCHAGRAPLSRNEDQHAEPGTGARVEFCWRWETNKVGDLFEASGALLKSLHTWERSSQSLASRDRVGGTVSSFWS